MLMHLMSFNVNHIHCSTQGLFLIINSFHIDAMNCQFRSAGVALSQTRECEEKTYEKDRHCRFRMAGHAVSDVVNGKRLASDRQ
ncbi:hypothetical protein FCH31_18475 [Lelliottia amnigena]|nr:hypothetical protein CO697_08695 [Lelliottia amnigena]NTX71396.1 hypothetical protein [Lelliottia amnigena]PEG66173.1 hypothetical protein CRH15_01770 [Lelliottia amnigena]